MIKLILRNYHSKVSKIRIFDKSLVVFGQKKAVKNEAFIKSS